MDISICPLELPPLPHCPDSPISFLPSSPPSSTAPQPSEASRLQINIAEWNTQMNMQPPWFAITWWHFLLPPIYNSRQDDFVLCSTPTTWSVLLFAEGLWPLQVACLLCASLHRVADKLQARNKMACNTSRSAGQPLVFFFSQSSVLIVHLSEDPFYMNMWDQTALLFSVVFSYFQYDGNGCAVKKDYQVCGSCWRSHLAGHAQTRCILDPCKQGSPGGSTGKQVHAGCSPYLRHGPSTHGQPFKQTEHHWETGSA